MNTIVKEHISSISNDILKIMGDSFDVDESIELINFQLRNKLLNVIEKQRLEDVLSHFEKIRATMSNVKSVAEHLKYEFQQLLKKEGE